MRAACSRLFFGKVCAWPISWKVSPNSLTPGLLHSVRCTLCPIAWPLWPAAREILATLFGVPQEQIHPDLLQSVSAALKEGVTDGAASAGVSDAPATLLQHARGVIEQTFAIGSAAPSSGSNDNASAEADVPAADDELIGQ